MSNVDKEPQVNATDMENDMLNKAKDVSSNAIK